MFPLEIVNSLKKQKQKSKKTMSVKPGKMKNYACKYSLV